MKLKTWNQRNTSALDELLAPTYQRNVSATATPLTSEVKDSALPDFTLPYRLNANGLKELLRHRSLEWSCRRF
jgi:hypothetical protein